MNVKKTLEEFFRLYGSRFSMEGIDDLHWGILSPKKAWDDSGTEAEPLGVGIRGRYLLMAPAEVSGLKKGSYLWLGRARYFVEDAEAYELGGAPLYRRAILRKCRTQAAAGGNP